MYVVPPSGGSWLPIIPPKGGTTYREFLCAVIVAIALGASFASASSQTTTAASFHHIHLNSIDPPLAINFYTKTFEVTKRASLAGFDAVQSEQMYLFFNKVASPPRSSLESAIWHFGWGSTAMEDDYRRHLTNGVLFHTPITRLGSGLLFAYMKGPDGALVEINTASSRAFLHVHLFSDAPLCAAEWYQKHLGATARIRSAGPCEVPFASPSEPLGVIRTPAATVRFGDISLIIYPRQRREPVVSPRGRVIDHIAVGYPNVGAELERLRNSGIRVLKELHQFGKSSKRSAMIEGPDSIAIELVESK